LTNVHRHSGSATAKIRIWQNHQEVLLEVSDRGRGMPLEVVAAHGGARAGHGIGILGMQERVKQLGGRLEIESGDHGTTIRAILPLAMVA
ncbi:MAG TPA: ATP-binding protein, partial [Bryobacterales bacterium]|nr:ATP-binding protein [Bryobacterales bacterium]